VVPASSLFLALVLSGCGDKAFDAVSIRPIYGWVDGCTPVAVGGHGFGDDVQVTIGGQALADQSLPDATLFPLDVGYEVYGTTPPSTAGKGTAEVKVSTGGVSDTVSSGFYYVDCPSPGTVEGIDPAEGVAAGDTITLQGCGLDPAAVTVRVGDAGDDQPLTAVCSTATATFVAPAVSKPAAWYVGFFDSAGTQLSPDPACDITLPAGSITNPDTADTAWVDPCSGAATLTYGGK